MPRISINYNDDSTGIGYNLTLQTDAQISDADAVSFAQSIISTDLVQNLGWENGTPSLLTVITDKTATIYSAE